jgi:4-carboxymuconolactone decarboxylase
MPRLPDLDPDALDPAQKDVYDAILSGPRGVVQGPLRVWLTSPELASHAQALGAFCRYGTSLPQRLSELAIVTTGAHWRAGFEWCVHAPIARAAGIDEAILLDIQHGGTPQFQQRDEAAVYGFTRELLQNRQVSAPTYQEAEAVLGPRGLVDLVGLLGYYGLISMTIVAFEVPVPPGEAEPFEAAS